MKFILIVLLLVGCSYTGIVKEPVLAQDVVVVGEADILNYWRPAKYMVPRFPFNMIRAQKFACVNVSYTITEDGDVIKPSIVNAFPEKGFSSSAINTILKLHYVPSKKNKARKPIRTNQIITYMIGVQSEQERMRIESKLHEMCKVNIAS